MPRLRSTGPRASICNSPDTIRVCRQGRRPILSANRKSCEDESAFECENDSESDGQCHRVIVALKETVQRLILAIFFLQTMAAMGYGEGWATVNES